MSWLCKVAGHSFEARYDKSAPVIPAHTLRMCHETVDLCRPVTYRCDVCTRCGMVVNRQEGK